MPAFDLRGRRRSFAAFEDDTQAVTNNADNFEFAWLAWWQYLHGKNRFRELPRIRRKCQADYDHVAASLAWAAELCPVTYWYRVRTMPQRKSRINLDVDEAG